MCVCVKEFSEALSLTYRGASGDSDRLEATAVCGEH